MDMMDICICLFIINLHFLMRASLKSGPIRIKFIWKYICFLPSYESKLVYPLWQYIMIINKQKLILNCNARILVSVSAVAQW